eukprot:Ihof_evm18s50 gene=Ihof_evmTU18s50
MVVVLRFFKLGGLLVRQLSVPVAKVIKKHAAFNPYFRRVFINFGRSWNFLELNIENRLKRSEVPVITQLHSLADEQCLEIGSDIFGELFVYVCAVIVVYYESQKAAIETKEKETVINESLNALNE